MKKKLLVLIIATLVVSMVSCGTKDINVTNEVKNNYEDNNEDELSKEKENKEEDKESNKINEDENTINVTPEKVGELIRIGDCAVGAFGGVKEIAAQYAETISDYAKILKDKSVYNIIIPTNIEFILPEKYSDLSVSQKDNIEFIKESESEEVKFVDAYSALEEHKDEYVYFRTDHHWTALGAYYAYCAYADAAGFEPIKLKDYKVKKKDNFLGTYYGSTQDQDLAKNPDYVEYYSVGADCKALIYKNSSLEDPMETTVYADYAEGASSYGVFLHGDYPLVKIENKNSKTDKKVIVSKESYGNAFAPFLIPQYSEVYVVDLRYFKNNLVDFINENNIDDVIFINNIFAANTKIHIDSLNSMK